MVLAAGIGCPTGTHSGSIGFVQRFAGTVAYFPEGETRRDESRARKARRGRHEWSWPAAAGMDWYESARFAYVFQGCPRHVGDLLLFGGRFVFCVQDGLL